MIVDRDIDLTTDGRFGEPRFYTSPEIRAHNKLFSEYRNNKHSNLFYEICKRSSELPWNKKLFDLTDAEKRRNRRSYGDWVSDDFGDTIRITEDNTLLLLGANIVNREVVDEYFLESFGYIPYTALKYCMNCSRKEISTLKNRLSTGYCKYHKDLLNRTPWQNKEINRGLI